MNKEFLGRGWAFPFHFDPATGAVAYSEFEENIRQNIMVIIGTRPGERQMLYDFGCRIHELCLLLAIRDRSSWPVNMYTKHWDVGSLELKC